MTATDSEDLEMIAAWLSEAPSCLREAWEKRRPRWQGRPLTTDEIMAGDWVAIDEMHQRYERLAEELRADEKAARISERRDLAMQESDWRASRGVR